LDKIKKDVSRQFGAEEEKAREEIVEMKEKQLKSAKAETPSLQLFNNLTPSAKDNIYSTGIREFKAQIDTRKKDYFSDFDKSMNSSSFIERFKTILPVDRLNSLVQISKDQISKTAATFIGTPGEGKATLY
jgi:hypothetical protein